VADRIRAAPLRTRFSSAAAGSWVLTRPMRGSTTCVPSCTRIAPVVNRHDTRDWRRDLNRGKPILGPRRWPALLPEYCFNPRARASGPELYASLLFCGHHGAISSLFAFHHRRSAGSVHGTSVS
jgi:hypothetical protein